MKNEKGLTLIQLLIVVALIGIIAAMVIPSILFARVTADARRFEKHFGVAIQPFIDTDAPPAERLAEDQKDLLRPLVNERIGTICSDPATQVKEANKARQQFLNIPPSTDPGQVVAQLARLRDLNNQVLIGQRIAHEGIAGCEEAKRVARAFGLLPQ